MTSVTGKYTKQRQTFLNFRCWKTVHTTLYIASCEELSTYDQCRHPRLTQTINNDSRATEN